MIGHSLGSVVAYDTLRARPSDQPVPLLVALRSPWGCPRSANGCNLSPRGFPQRSGGGSTSPHPTTSWLPAPHQINFYLTKKSCGAAVADALT